MSKKKRHSKTIVKHIGEQQSKKGTKQKDTRLADTIEKLQWLQAEYENYKKRAEKDKQNCVNRAKDEILLKILDVSDNLKRAVTSAEQNPDPKTLVEGVKMISTQLKDILKKEGVAEIHALGQKFDPQLHDAVMTEHSDEHEDHTIIEELQGGYIKHEKIIRPTKVKVAIKKE